MNTTTRPPQAPTQASDDSTSSTQREDAIQTRQWAETPSTWRKDLSIEFRVRCDGQPNRRLRLSGTRYTLGSGVGCSIRLEDPRLRPLHAVLIRDRERISVRAYSVPFEINDVRVMEGLLSVGDKLRLGAYEFELLESTPRPIDAVSQSITNNIIDLSGSTGARDSDHGYRSSEQSGGAVSESSDWTRSFQDEAKQWRALKQDVQRRDAWCQSREQELAIQQEKLDHQMRLLLEREEELQTQEHAAVEVHDEFKRRYEEMQKRQEELILQQEELAAGREHLRLQQDRLDGRDRLHRQQIEKLLSEQENFKRREHLQQQQLAERELQIKASQEQATAASAAVEQMRAKFTSLNEQLAQLSIQQTSLQRLEAKRSHDHEVKVAELTQQRDEASQQIEALAEERDELLKSKADSDSRRRQAEKRCDQLETIEDDLKREIEQLQSVIAETRREAESLDTDCQATKQTIADLQERIRDDKERHESDRKSWTDEVEALRQNVEELSVELANAQVQLTQLRDDNDRLAEQLSGAYKERDQARLAEENAVRECEAALQASDVAKMEFEVAARNLEEARRQYEKAVLELDDAEARRQQVTSELKTTRSDRDQWIQRAEEADARYAAAQTELEDAKQKCQVATQARDDAETDRAQAEEKLAEAQSQLNLMRAERDQAIRNQDDMRDQRDQAISDAKDTRELYDRSNRDLDDTLDQIETLEQRTREIISGSGNPLQAAEPALGILRQDIEPEVSDDDVLANERSEWKSPETRSESELETAAEETLQVDEEHASAELDSIYDASSSVDESLWSESAEDDSVWPTYSSDPMVEPSHRETDGSDETSESGELPNLGTDELAIEAFEEVELEDSFESPSLAENELSSHTQDESMGAVTYDASFAAPMEEDLPEWPEASQTCLLPEDSQWTSFSESSFSDVSDPANPFAQPTDDDESLQVPEESSDLDDRAASEPKQGSLAEQLMRDLGIEQVEKSGRASTHDSISATSLDHAELSEASDEEFESSDAFNDEMSQDGLSATAMWDSRNHLSDDTGAGTPPVDDELESAEAPEHAACTALLGSVEEAMDLVKSDIDGGNAAASVDQDELTDETFSNDRFESEPSSIETQAPEAAIEEDEMQEQIVVQPPATNENASEDESIEDYMNRLLQRVQGQSPASAPTPAAKPSPVKASPAPVVAEVNKTSKKQVEPQTEREPVANQPEAAVDPNTPLVPRSQAPERSRDLSAMRELANESARSAITRSNQSQSHTRRIQAMVKFAQGGIAALCGVAAVVMVNVFMLKVIAAIAALVIAAICAKEGMLHLTDLGHRGNADVAQPTSDDSDDLDVDE